MRMQTIMHAAMIYESLHCPQYRKRLLTVAGSQCSEIVLQRIARFLSQIGGDVLKRRDNTFRGAGKRNEVIAIGWQKTTSYRRMGCPMVCETYAKRRSSLALESRLGKATASVVEVPVQGELIVNEPVAVVSCRSKKRLAAYTSEIPRWRDDGRRSPSQPSSVYLDTTSCASSSFVRAKLMK